MKAVNKIIAEKSGQVQGAFYHKDIGDIDVVWGKVTDAKKHTGFGIAHILDKHPDFEVSLIPEIIEKGKIDNVKEGQDWRKKQNIDIRYNKYIIGIRNGFNSNGKKVSSNRWIVTSYEEN